MLELANVSPHTSIYTVTLKLKRFIRLQGRVFRLPSETTLRRSHTAVRQMATRNVANVLLLRNRIKLTLTVALTLTDTVTVIFTLISLTPIKWLYRHNKRNFARGAGAGFVGGPVFPVCVSQVQMSVHWVAEIYSRLQCHHNKH